MAGDPNEEPEGSDRSRRKQSLVSDLALRLVNGDLESRIQAARDIRKLAKASASTRSVFAAAGVIQPLVSMLGPSEPGARESALLALLNLAARNERNKVKIVTSGAVPPLLELLKLETGSLRDLATAAILTLSASAANKPIIAASGATSLLVQILSSGSVQGKVDAVTALYNLSTCKHNFTPALASLAVPSLLSLLKECKKYSKFAEKSTALLEILSGFEEGRIAISNSDGGILTVVETVEDGSLESTEHAVGVLLSLCRSCRSKYRELILGEGAIPGLLQLTAEGTPKAQESARTLLDLLRDSPPQQRLASAVLESFVYDIASQVESTEKAAETAKKLLRDMVQRSMEINMTRMQLRAKPSEISRKISGGPARS